MENIVLEKTFSPIILKLKIKTYSMNSYLERQWLSCPHILDTWVYLFIISKFILWAVYSTYWIYLNYHSTKSLVYMLFGNSYVVD